MNRSMHSSTFWALLIVAALVSAYVIVAANPSAIPGGQVPPGVFH